MAELLPARLFAKFGLYVVRDFLDADECARLRAAAQAGASMPAMVLKAGIRTLDEESRRTVRVEIPSEEAARVSARLETLRPTLEERFRRHSLGWEAPQHLVYHPGDFFRRHHDRSFEPEEEVTGRRRVSIVVFLNGTGDASDTETFDGGVLTFYGLLADPRLHHVQYPLRAEAGLLIAFPSYVLHEVTPVTRGERHTVVAWLRET